MAAVSMNGALSDATILSPIIPGTKQGNYGKFHMQKDNRTLECVACVK